MVVRNCDIKDDSGPFDGGIYFYRARVDLREFTIGCDEMWRHHHKTYNSHYESDEEEAAVKGVDADDAVYEPPKKRSEIHVTLRKKPSSRARAATRKG